MAKVGAQRAAELTGKSKSTIQRAMNAGKLSFEVDDNGRRLIDVSELERAFGIQPQTGKESTAPASSRDTADAGLYVMELELEKARHAVEVERLKMELRMAQEHLEMAQQQIADLKVQRDLWQKQAQQILITSQYSQKQSEERIAEMREREEARQRAVDAKRAQQPQPARPVFHSTQQPVQQQATTAAAAPVKSAPVTGNVQPAAQTQGPVFRTVQAGNQNKSAQTAADDAQKTSLFASLFGGKKKRKA